MRDFRTTLLCGVISVVGVAALAQDGPHRFDVASIKVSDRSDFGSFRSSPGSLQITSLPLRTIIAHAYGFGPTRSAPDMAAFKITGGDQRILASRFDVDARADSRLDASFNMLMLQSLLAERFKLRVHTETRQMPIYALVRGAKGLGPGLHSSDFDCDEFLRLNGTWKEAEAAVVARCAQAPDRRSLPPGVAGFLYAGKLSTLVRQAQVYLDRPLVDLTGLDGIYEWRTTFAPSPEADDLPLPAAFQRDLGLRIEARVGPTSVYVIDSVEMPSPN